MRFIISVILCLFAISATFAFNFITDKEQINFDNYSTGAERKQAFISFLTPVIEKNNRKILDDRNKLIRLSQKSKLNIREQRWLNHISQIYNNDSIDPHDNRLWSSLLDKIDIIPVSLALAQGAKESGWGTSRFAQLANNYFGQWCYSKGCGLIPNKRQGNASHEVASYNSVEESVSTYMNNLNTNPAYQKLRDIRAQLRNSGKVITGEHLAKGLYQYSETGQNYVKELQSLIRNIKLVLSS
ncbi:MAG: glucosaminidase domain-containing protein [Gammaproteobacteria bacterium]|nr:glucosaminidase domain-containing protein [Gammaproteobacteria bacterium]